MPDLKCLSLAYLAGVVEGDGWCTDLALGLRVKDRDFAVAFALAIEDAFGIEVWPQRDERGYWLTRTSNQTGRFDVLLTPDLRRPDATAAWLRGFFDSEGNAQLTKAKISRHAWSRRVAFYNTDLHVLARAATLLNRLGIRTQLRLATTGPGHLGTKQVYELRVSPGQANYNTFLSAVGSTIGRKQDTLVAMVASYQAPGHHARASARGKEARRVRRDAGGVY